MEEIRGVVKATVTSLVQKTHRIRTFPPQNCEVIQLARITGSDPVHARSNRALAAKFRKWSQSLAWMSIRRDGFNSRCDRHRGDDPMGRALVSKTSSSRFESCHSCQV